MAPKTVATWQGIPVANAGTYFEQMPENIPHYWDRDLPSAEYPGMFTLQVVAVGYYSDGTIPDDPPEQYRSPLYHRAKPFVMPEPGHEPRAFFNNGFCSTEGWAAPRTSWRRSTGPGSSIPMHTDDWCWVNYGDGPGTPTNGTIGTPPEGLAGPNLAAYTGQLLAAAHALESYLKANPGVKA